MNQTIAIGGSTGLVGERLAKALQERGDRVLRLTRPSTSGVADESAIAWDPKAGTLERDRLAQADAVIHLGGANVAKGPWTEERKRLIRDSRVQSTALLSEALADMPAEKRPKAFLCASAIGYYGDRGDEWLDETSEPGPPDFLTEVSREWEAATQAAADSGVRVVNLRIGVVLSPDGGALAKMLTPFKLGVGGVVGSGRQYMSWIDLDDVVGAIIHCLTRDDVQGPVNLTAPNPAANREFTKTLGRVLHRPTFLPLPTFAVKLGFGEMGEDLLLASTRVKPKALLDSGYAFHYPDLEASLRHQLSR